MRQLHRLLRKRETDVLSLEQQIKYIHGRADYMGEYEGDTEDDDGVGGRWARRVREEYGTDRVSNGEEGSRMYQPWREGARPDRARFSKGDVSTYSKDAYITESKTRRGGKGEGEDRVRERPGVGGGGSFIMRETSRSYDSSTPNLSTGQRVQK